jgi:hypothetical protein
MQIEAEFASPARHPTAIRSMLSELMAGNGKWLGVRLTRWGDIGSV